jgi:hypothetical protein
MTENWRKIQLNDGKYSYYNSITKLTQLEEPSNSDSNGVLLILPNQEFFQQLQSQHLFDLREETQNFDDNHVMSKLQVITSSHVSIGVYSNRCFCFSFYLQN